MFSTLKNNSVLPMILLLTGVVQWDGVEAPRLHRCEECRPQDAGEQRCCAGVEHRTQPLYSGTEMGISVQQSPGAKGYFTLHASIQFVFTMNSGKCS